MKRRHFLAATGTAGTWRISNAAPAPQRLVVAAFPLVDKIVEAAMPAWQAQHPGVEVQVISKQYADHHTAMTTALSTSGSGAGTIF
jgi:multiple sugar transport system substrate-binding protein